MYPNPASRSAALFQRAQAVLPGGNTRHTVHFDPYPVYAQRGRGAWVTDVDGQDYLDYVNNYSALIHGHGHPKVLDAMVQQASELVAVGLPTEGEIRLAELLVERLPSVEQVRFANSGTEAVMFAIRAARAYTGRPCIAKVEGAYHGAYDAAETSMDPTPANWGDATQPQPVGHARGTPAGLLGDVLVLPFNDMEATRRLLDAQDGQIAGVLFDALVSRMGFLPATPEYLALLREWTRANGALLIQDEVFSFRLGYQGAQGHYGIDPDLTALGKIIGGGLPIGAVGGRREFMQVFDHRSGHAAVPHGGTFNANPLAMAAGHASMALMTHAAYDHINTLGDRLRDGLNRLFAQRGIAGVARGVGSMVAVMLGPAAQAPYRDYRGFLPAMAQSVPRMLPLHRAMLARGVLFIPYGGLITSTAMTEADIDLTLEKFDDALKNGDPS
jgi:glutamate-1-semialdehyde 2,1-aminomutase